MYACQQSDLPTLAEHLLSLSHYIAPAAMRLDKQAVSKRVGYPIFILLPSMNGSGKIDFDQASRRSQLTMWFK
jgi:hypothetical protein